MNLRANELSCRQDRLQAPLETDEATPSLHEVFYDSTNDPLAPFIAAFDGDEEDAGWIERHDGYFVGDSGECYGNKE